MAAETHLAVAPVRQRARCVLVFPNTYQVGMASLAVHTLYEMLNRSGLACERAFVAGGGPRRGARSLESDTPLGGFDFILISSSFELDWLQLPALLQQGGVSPLRADRGPEHPIVIAGGPALTANPHPLAPLVDVCVLGEIEPIREPFIAALREPDTREEVLERLGALPGVWLPGLAEPKDTLPERQYASRLDEFSTESAILTPYAEFGERFLIEVGRGCGRGCRFCLARQLYHPNRMRAPQMLLERIGVALETTRQVGLVGAAISDYPWIEELFAGLARMGASVTVSSVRAESVTRLMLQVLVASGQDTLTVAPEAGSEALRSSIGKGMTDEQLIGCLDLAREVGLRRFKLYFMVGLPGEEWADIEAIERLLRSVRDAVPGVSFSVVLSPFVPKPHTPLADAPMLPTRELTRRLNRVSSALRALGIRDLDVGSARWAAAQTLMGRAGSELGPALVEASLAGGRFADFQRAVRRAGIVRDL